MAAAGGQPDSVRAVHGAVCPRHCLRHPRDPLGEFSACLVRVRWAPCTGAFTVAWHDRPARISKRKRKCGSCHLCCCCSSAPILRPDATCRYLYDPFANHTNFGGDMTYGLACACRAHALTPPVWSCSAGFYAGHDLPDILAFWFTFFALYNRSVPAQALVCLQRTRTGLSSTHARVA